MDRALLPCCLLSPPAVMLLLEVCFHLQPRERVPRVDEGVDGAIGAGPAAVRPSMRRELTRSRDSHLGLAKRLVDGGPQAPEMGAHRIRDRKDLQPPDEPEHGPGPAPTL